MADISDLESQYELESNEDSEFEYGEDAEMDDDSELDDEFESGDEPEGELDQSQTYGERFHELAMHEFETDEELEVGLRDILGEMEQQYFIGGLVKRGLGGLVKRGMGVAKKAAGKLARRAASMAASHLKGLPIAGVLKGASSLLGKNLTDQLMRLAASAVPGGAIGLPALQALGIIPGGNTGNPAADSETWDQFAEFAQEVYETAADQVNASTLNPVSALGVAGQVIGNVVQRRTGVARRGYRGAGRAGSSGRRVIRVRPGESVLVVCK
jgi:hypothetical protein